MVQRKSNPWRGEEIERMRGDRSGGDNGSFGSQQRKVYTPPLRMVVLVCWCCCFFVSTMTGGRSL